MKPKDEKPRPKDRGSYRKFFKFETRWRDNDQYGHMNNAVFYELFDSAVNKFLIESGILGVAVSRTVFLVVSSSCNYFNEVAYPSDIEIGLAISQLGFSSITYELGLFVEGENKTAAAGSYVHVNVDSTSQQPCAINDLARLKCVELMLKTESI